APPPSGPAHGVAQQRSDYAPAVRGRRERAAGGGRRRPGAESRVGQKEAGPRRPEAGARARTLDVRRVLGDPPADARLSINVAVDSRGMTTTRRSAGPVDGAKSPAATLTTLDAQAVTVENRLVAGR